MMFGAAPFGVIFGTLAAPSGLSAGGALGMSLIVFAGSSQFIALSLLAGQASLAVIVLTTFVVNLRHALYSASLLPYVSKLSQAWRVPLAFWLTDETFAVVLQRYGAADDSPHKHWYQLGSSVSMYVNWFLWTLTGVLLGRTMPQLQTLGLEFAMAATFTGIVVPLLRTRPMVASALVAAVVALLCRNLPYKLGLMLAALAGVAAGMALEPRPAPEQEAP
jgi:4-azaleucine resistance transporter AzlC